ncbi:MAG: phage baseplate assembly protein V [Rhodospirillales bacterium]|nr:phage baseplate assembly protein V [Rhodospirillales bacterium]
MQRFFNALKAQATALDAAHGRPRFATVVSVDPTRHAARVALQPEGVVTGWLPVISPLVGAGWGIAVPPVPGQQVLVLPQDGDGEHGIIVGGAWSDAAPTPGAPVGELWLVHQSGSFVKLQNDGTVRVNGDLHVNGDVYDRHGSLDRLRGNYNVHAHSDPQGGSTGATGSPDPE